MRSLVSCLVLLVACSSASKPDPAPAPPAPAPTEPAPTTVMTKEECEAKGARVNPSIGGGSQSHCADAEVDLGPVRLGIEGGWCCQAK
jgi:hypothetical protein